MTTILLTTLPTTLLKTPTTTSLTTLLTNSPTISPTTLLISYFYERICNSLRNSSNHWWTFLQISESWVTKSKIKKHLNSKFKPSFPKKSKNLLKEGTKLLVYKGLIRWSLMAVLPFVVLAVISSQIRQTDSTQTIEVPKNFCELDARQEV